MKKVVIVFFSLILIVPASGQLKLEQIHPHDIGKGLGDFPAYMGCIESSGAGGDLLIIPVASHQDSGWKVYIAGPPPPPIYKLCVETWKFIPQDPPGSLNVKVADVYVGADHFDVVVDYGYYTRTTTTAGGKAHGTWPGGHGWLYDVGQTLPDIPIVVAGVEVKTGYEFLWLSGTAVDLGYAWSTLFPWGAYVWLDYDYFAAVPEQCYIKGVVGFPVGPGFGVPASLPGTKVGLEFEQITSAGHVILDYITGPELPSGFQLGERGKFFDITTTAGFSGLVEVAIDYSNMDFTVPEEMLQLFHYDGGLWSDCTTSIDTLNDIIYGSVSSLSTFAVVQNSNPQVLVEQVIAQVEGLDLEQGIDNSLNSKLESALKILDDFNDNNDVAAINSLEAFINAVEAQRGKKIPEEDADALIDAVQQIIDLLTNG